MSTPDHKPPAVKVLYASIPSEASIRFVSESAFRGSEAWAQGV